MSEIDALRNSEGVIDLNAQITHGAFKLGVPQQELNGSQVTGLPIDQRRFGATQEWVP